MQTWGLTDPGNIRQQNQDSYAIVPFGRDRVLMIVCDGMGGAKSGNVASSLAVEVFTDEVRRTQRPGMTPEKAAAMLRSALELSNSAVYEQSQLSDDFTGMGTTLVAAWISRDLAVVINVGDSRAYHFTREDVRLITRDHSMVAYMVERGELTQEQAKLHPGKTSSPAPSAPSRRSRVISSPAACAATSAFCSALTAFPTKWPIRKCSLRSSTV